MPQVLTFTNNKGGTGKSTLCTNCAHLVAQTGMRVLLIDLTSQRTSSQLLLGEIDDLAESETILACLSPEPQQFLEEVIFESPKGLDVVPSHVSMAQAVARLAQLPQGGDRILQHQLERVADNYDYIFLDSPGDLNVLTANVLLPADVVLIPTRLNRTDFSCTETTIRFVQQAEHYIGRRRPRVILNMLDDRYLPGGIWANAHTGQLYQQAQQVFKDVLSPVTIPDSSDIRTAFDRGLTVLEYKPDTLVSLRLRALVDQEVIRE